MIIHAVSDIEKLNRFPCGGYSDESTIVYLSHPCNILTALEVCVNIDINPFSSCHSFHSDVDVKGLIQFT